MDVQVTVTRFLDGCKFKGYANLPGRGWVLFADGWMSGTKSYVKKTVAAQVQQQAAEAVRVQCDKSRRESVYAGYGPAGDFDYSMNH